MGFGRFSRAEAVSGLIWGPRFKPDTEGHFFLKEATEYGVSWPLLHAQSRLFLDYLQERDPDALERQLLALYDGRDFGASFEEQYGESLDAVWAEFLAAVHEEPLPAAGGAGL